MIFIILFAIFFVLSIIAITINVKIEFENLRLQLPKINGKIINKQAKIFLKIFVLKNIKIAEINLRKINMNDEKYKTRIDKIKKKIKEKGTPIKFDLSVLKILSKEKFIIEKMKLEIYAGLEDAALTAIEFGAISGILSNILRNKIKDAKKQKFEVFPIYENKNILKIDFDGIFEFNIANIIDILKLLLRKRRVEENGRTSNRRSYAYSNE